MLEEKEEVAAGYWKVLIVDDDNFVHQIIKEINKKLVFEKKGIEFLSAYSTEEALRYLEKDREIALVLIDVFLEEEDSGLKLARHIREDLKIDDLRIILITGKGSRELQEAVMVNYDINGYENKSDLFSKKMHTVIISALRSYKDIRRIKSNRLATANIVDSLNNLYKIQNTEDFLISALCHLSSVVNKCKGTMENVCCKNAFAAIKEKGSNYYRVLTGCGLYEEKTGDYIRNILDKETLDRVREVYETGSYMVYPDACVAEYESSTGERGILYIGIKVELESIDMELLEVFHKSVGSIFETLCLNIEIEETQKEILYTLGEVTEARSEETGNHVKRVSKYCEILAREYGLSDLEVAVLSHASPMHDIGKIAIPDSILLKPGRLTEEEFEIMKKHTTIGYNLFKNSNRDILKAAAIIAHEHHERYDGKGYPRGVKGEDIHIFGRIAAIADVFDALGSERVYKKPWVLNDIILLFKEERGRQFDPVLVDLFFENLDKFLEIREKYSDK